jgi:hypothetical protein
MSGKGDTNRTTHFMQYGDNFDAIKWSESTLQPGINVFDPETGEFRHGQFRKMDNGEMRSSAMGCVDPVEQKKRKAIYASKGLDVDYHPETCEMIYRGGQGGSKAQQVAAKLHGLDID